MNWNFTRATRRGAVCAIALAAATSASAAAQGVPQNAGVVVGIVANCVNNVEQPIQGASVNATGSSLNVITDQNGQFALGLAPGTYTIDVTSVAGNGSRPNVPIDAGELLDVGTIDVGSAAMTGCGAEDTPAPAPGAATAAPTAAPTVVPTATPVPPTPVPSATSAPSPDQSSPDVSSPNNTGAPDVSPQPDDDATGTD
jgi:hypothetical protein